VAFSLLALAALHARLHPAIDHDQRMRGSIITVGRADKTAVRGNLSQAGSHFEQRAFAGP
jgi:hypothetical protein